VTNTDIAALIALMTVNFPNFPLGPTPLDPPSFKAGKGGEEQGQNAASEFQAVGPRASPVSTLIVRPMTAAVNDAGPLFQP